MHFSCIARPSHPRAGRRRTERTFQKMYTNILPLIHSDAFNGCKIRGGLVYTIACAFHSMKTLSRHEKAIIPVPFMQDPLKKYFIIEKMAKMLRVSD